MELSQILVEDVGWREGNQQRRKQKTQESPAAPPKTLRAPQVADPSHPADKASGNGRNSSGTCCFCWCCCCSCSCISIQDREESQGRPSEDLGCDPITHEEVLMWGKSFEKLLKNKKGQEVFRQFLRSEFSEENVLFWIACENLKHHTPTDHVEEQARNIYEDYISIFSPKEVSLDSEVRELIDRNMVNPTRSTFDEAQIQIFTLMQRDSYPRFLSSNLYKQLLNSTQPSTCNQQPAASAASAASLAQTTCSAEVVITAPPHPSVVVYSSTSQQPLNIPDIPKVFSNFPGTTSTSPGVASVASTTNNVKAFSTGAQTNAALQGILTKDEKQPLLNQESTKTSPRINSQGALSASSALEQLQQQNSVEINYLTSGTDSAEARKSGFELQTSGPDIEHIPGGDATVLAVTAINT